MAIASVGKLSILSVLSRLLLLLSEHYTVDITDISMGQGSSSKQLAAFLTADCLDHVAGRRVNSAESFLDVIGEH